jgi:hypothetical protein
MKRILPLMLALVSLCAAQIAVPEGTKVRIRLEQTVSSGTAENGATLEFAATQAVEIGGAVVIAEGARATGTVTQAVERRRMGRSGKFDFSIDRVMATDGKWISLRYAPNKARGEGRGISTAVVTAGIGLVFWPAAPVGLLIKGKDVTVNKGTVFEVFSDENVTVSGYVPGSAQATARALYPVANPSGAHPGSLSVPVSYQTQLAQAYQPQEVQSDRAGNDGSASLSITSSAARAEIEVDGAFVGNTPSTIRLPAGAHDIRVSAGSQVWNRAVRVSAGSTITLDAAFAGKAAVGSRATQIANRQ